MEINIDAYAHYDNGDAEHLYKETEVTDEEYDIIKKCADENDGELDMLEEQSPELYEKLYELFVVEEELDCKTTNFRRIRTSSGLSSVYRRTPKYLTSITMCIEE